VSASVNLPLHHKVQKFSSGTGSHGWSRKKGHEMVMVWCGGTEQVYFSCDCVRKPHPSSMNLKYRILIQCIRILVVAASDPRLYVSDSSCVADIMLTYSIRVCHRSTGCSRPVSVDDDDDVGYCVLFRWSVYSCETSDVGCRPLSASANYDLSSLSLSLTPLNLS